MMRPCLIITRPLQDSVKLAETLSAAGYESLLEPCLQVEPVEAARAELLQALEHPPQAVIVTSRNAVTAIARFFPRRDTPIYSVGEATGLEALRRGFSNVRIAPGTVHDLSEFIASHAHPSKGRLLYAAGRDLAADLPQLLAVRGFETRKIIVYKAHASERLGQATTLAIHEKRVKAVLFYSRRSARIFEELAGKESLASSLATVTALCLSRNITNALSAGLWKSVQAAASPTSSAMLALVKHSFPLNT